MINIDPTVMVALLLKPDTPSSKFKMPVTIKSTMTNMETVSMDTFSVMNSTIASIMIENTIPISTVILHFMIKAFSHLSFHPEKSKKTNNN